MAFFCDAYGVYPTFTGYSNTQYNTRPQCGDRSSSSQGRYNWWCCRNSVSIKSNGGYLSQGGVFRCSHCKDIDNVHL